jgi:ubiquinone/menaquinone biosynthesis C-methylase UbiE
MSNDGRQHDQEANVEFYTALLERHGANPKALDWGSVQSQSRRFEVLAEIGDLSGASLLDVGCGLGDLYGWLDGKGSYKGIDITPAMILAARNRFPSADFEVADVMNVPFSPRSFDYVFASGIFYLGHSEPFAFMKDMVRRMYEICRRGVAFNTLSAWRIDKDEDEFHADPAVTLEFCHELTPSLVLRHDYHAGDFTVYLYRCEGRAG